MYEDHIIQGCRSHEDQARHACIVEELAKVVEGIQNILAESLRKSLDEALGDAIVQRMRFHRARPLDVEIRDLLILF